MSGDFREGEGDIGGDLPVFIGREVHREFGFDYCVHGGSEIFKEHNKTVDIDGD